jgi:hypothetical protein
MPDIHATVHLPDDAQPGQSHTNPGSYSPNVFDSRNKLDGQITWTPDDEDDEDEDSSGISLGAIIGIGVAAALAAGVTHAIGKRKQKKEQCIRPTQVATPQQNLYPALPINPTSLSTYITQGLNDPRIAMSSAEAKERLISIMLSVANIAEQMRALSQANILDDEPYSMELRGIVRQLTSSKVIEMLNFMLARNPHQINQATFAKFTSIFDGGGILYGRYIPVRPERVAAIFAF